MAVMKGYKYAAMSNRVRFIYIAWYHRSQIFPKEVYNLYSIEHHLLFRPSLPVWKTYTRRQMEGTLGFYYASYFAGCYYHPIKWLLSVTLLSHSMSIVSCVVIPINGCYQLLTFSVVVISHGIIPLKGSCIPIIGAVAYMRGGRSGTENLISFSK